MNESRILNSIKLGIITAVANATTLKDLTNALLNVGNTLEAVHRELDRINRERGK